MLGKLNGVVFTALIFVSSLLGSIFLLFPYIPLAKFFPKQWRFLADRFVGLWLTFPAVSLSFTDVTFFFFGFKHCFLKALLEKLFGCSFRVTGDMIKKEKAALIIMNHRTRHVFFFILIEYNSSGWTGYFYGTDCIKWIHGY